MVLDSHTHAWGAPNPEHPWVNDSLISLTDSYSVDVVYSADKLVRDIGGAGVYEAILVPFPLVDWTDNSYILEAVERHDELVGGIVMLDIFADDAPTRLRELLAHEKIIGFRIGCIYPRDNMWKDDYFDPSVEWLVDSIEHEAFWQAARETNALVKLFAHRDQLWQVAELVEAYPDLSYAIDHLAHVDPTIPPEEGSFAEFETLAEFENVAVNVSEVPHISNEAYPYRDVHDHVRWLLEQFGKQRLIWGSDFPNISAVTDYKRGLTWLEHVDGLSDAEREWLTERSFRTHVGL